MPSVSSIYSLIRKKLDMILVDPAIVVVGNDSADDQYVIKEDDGKWDLFWAERGRLRIQATFNNGPDAAEYLIFLLFKEHPDVKFPQIDWTEYASLP
jgi:hypothetical protein